MEKKLEFTTLEKGQIIDIAKRLKDTIGKTLYHLMLLILLLLLQHFLLILLQSTLGMK